MIESLQEEYQLITKEFDVVRLNLEYRAEEEINILKEDNDGKLKQIECQLEDAEVQKKTKSNTYEDES